MTDICDLISLAAQVKKLYVSCCRQVCKKYDITQTEFDVLEYLSTGSSSDTSAEIARNRQIQKANVCTAVDRLIAKGYLTRRPDEKDKRLIHLSLTAEAGMPCIEIMQAKEDFMSKLTSLLSEHELENLTAIADRLASYDKKLIEQE